MRGAKFVDRTQQMLENNTDLTENEQAMKEMNLEALKQLAISRSISHAEDLGKAGDLKKLKQIKMAMNQIPAKGKFILNIDTQSP